MVIYVRHDDIKVQSVASGGVKKPYLSGHENSVDLYTTAVLKHKGYPSHCLFKSQQNPHAWELSLPTYVYTCTCQ